MKPDLNEFAARCHHLALAWWQDPKTGLPIERNPRELLMLAISEIAEAMEGERKNLMDDHLKARRMAEVEIADYVIRLADFAGGMGIESIYIPSPLLPERIPDNKGEALYGLVAFTQEIMNEDSEFTKGEQIGWAIAYAEAYCQKHGYQLWAAVEEKLEYNRTREDHSHAARLQENGKQF